MKKCLMCLGFGLLMVLGGCVPSLHPLYTDKDLTFDPALIGRWSPKDSKETWTFTRSGENQYKLMYVDGKGKRGEFVVHLLKVKGQVFLDLFPADPDLKANDFYKIHLLPTHSFMIVKQIEPPVWTSLDISI